MGNTARAAPAAARRNGSKAVGTPPEKSVTPEGDSADPVRYYGG